MNILEDEKEFEFEVSESEPGNQEEAYMDLPLLPLRNLVVLPNNIVTFELNRKKSIAAATKAMKSSGSIFLVMQKDPFILNPDYSDLYEIGVYGKVLQLVREENEGLVKIAVEGIQRAVINHQGKSGIYMSAIIKTLNTENDCNEIDAKAYRRVLKDLFFQYTTFFPHISPDTFRRLESTKDYCGFMDLVIGNVNFEPEDKQKMLEMLSIKERSNYLLTAIQNEIYILSLQNKIREKAKIRIDENQREYFLHEQLRAIQEELGDGEDLFSECEDYRFQINALELPDVVRKAFLKECSRLEKTPMGSPEANIIRTYLDTCLELPWNISTKEKIDIQKVRTALDKHHYGLEKVKERILELLAVRALSKDVKGQIICLVGPPGVGKTSIAQSVAKAINRKYARIALGGVHDEAEIRGHRRTYIGAMCGRIINAVKQAGSNNPLIVLDEIDKVGKDYKGDPAAALLEVLDSEQNSTFCDHYIDVPFDLSKVMFITTANDFSSIPAPLQDRMDVIEISSYTREEKFNIAKKHLVPKQLKNSGISARQVKISKDVLYAIIDSYTREAGVRGLERTIAKLLRKSAVKIVEENQEKVVINTSNLREFLGSERYKNDRMFKNDEIGVATGLAWTSVGGETLPVEVAVVKGSGKLELTGSLGDVMQESAKTALTCVRTRAKDLNIPEDFYKNYDIHIHAPEGAVPKDGPSAGITMATAIVSAFTNTPVKRTVAMTGEITLRGRVLPIGGLKEKSMAAYRLGIETVIIPEDNLADLDEIDSVVKEAINFVSVSKFEQVLEVALKQ